MPHYDLYGTYFNDFNDSNNSNNNIELFTNLDECIDNKIYDCSKIATNYKKCFIEGISSKCCNSCKQFNKCEDTLANCNDIIKLNDGKCDNVLWNKCCISCSNINSNPQTSPPITIPPSIKILTSAPSITPNPTPLITNHSFSNPPLLTTNPPLLTTNPPLLTNNPPLLTTYPPLKKTDILPDCKKYIESCNQNNYKSEFMNYFCNNTCNNCIDAISSCNNYLHLCNNNDIVGSSLRNYYCCDSCNKNI